MKECHLSLKSLAVLFFIAMYLSCFPRNCNLNNEKSKGSST